MIDADTALFASLGLVTGLVAGVFGVGGGFVLVPLLTLAGLPVTAAIATSLAFIAPVAATGALRHVRQATADPLLALPMVVASVIFAQAGARAADLLGDEVLAAAFAALLIGTAVWLLTGRGGGAQAGTMPRAARRFRYRRERRLEDGTSHAYAVDVPLLVLVGCAAGLLSGLLGVSAGFVTVPLLARGFGVPMQISVGTGLMVSAATAVSAAGAYASLGAMRLDVLAAIVPAGLAGVLLGARITLRVPPARLRVAFAVVMLAAAVKPLSLAIG